MPKSAYNPSTWVMSSGLKVIPKGWKRPVKRGVTPTDLPSYSIDRIDVSDVGRFAKIWKNRISLGFAAMPGHFQSSVAQLSHGSCQAAVDLVFPSVCRLCDAGVARQADFCRRCETELTASQRMMASACRRCGRPGVATASATDDAPSSPSPAVADTECGFARRRLPAMPGFQA